MTTYINSVDKSTTIYIVYSHLIQPCKIRKSLPYKTVYLLTNDLIFSRLDYCSTLLTNSTKLQLLQLDRIIKSTTRLICNKRKFDRCSISSLMSSLKIVAIDLRIKTRLSKLIHTVLYKNTPTYLTDLLHLNIIIRQLRNSNSKLLTPPIGIPSTENNTAEGLFGIWLHLRGIIFQTIYGNQPYIEEAIYLNIRLRTMFI